MRLTLLCRWLLTMREDFEITTKLICTKFFWIILNEAGNLYSAVDWNTVYRNTVFLKILTLLKESKKKIWRKHFQSNYKPIKCYERKFVFVLEWHTLFCIQQMYCNRLFLFSLKNNTAYYILYLRPTFVKYYLI